MENPAACRRLAALNGSTFMGKSLGQRAYEAYCAQTNWKSLVSGASLPQWQDVKPEIAAAWEAAGQAVAEPFRAALKDAISVCRDDDKTSIVTDERLETWKFVAAL